MGIIQVIYATSIGVTVSRWRGVLSVASLPWLKATNRPEKRLKLNKDPITFNEDGLEKTSQPHDYALVVTLRIGGFLMKRVMIDQGSSAEIMYSMLGLVLLNPIVWCYVWHYVWFNVVINKVVLWLSKIIVTWIFGHYHIVHEMHNMWFIWFSHRKYKWQVLCKLRILVRSRWWNWVFYLRRL